MKKIILLPDGLYLIDAPDKSLYVIDDDGLERYTQALEQAIKEGVKFANTHEASIALWKSIGQEIYEQGKLYDIPEGYQVEIKENFCGCYDLKGPSKECLEAGGKYPYKCINITKVAVLEPLTKQEPEKSNFNEWMKDLNAYAKGIENFNKSGESTPVQVGQSNALKGFIWDQPVVEYPTFEGEYDQPNPERNYMEDLDNLTKEITPVIEQKRKSAFEIIKWKIGKIIGEKFLEYNDGKFHTAVELNPAIHAVAEFCEQYAESKQLTPTDGWISVKDRLPENNCDVLAYKDNGRIIQMSYHAPFDSGKRIFQWWGFGQWVNQHSQVTHWMPLPKSPIK